MQNPQYNAEFILFITEGKCAKFVAENAESDWLPNCTSRGRYERKQCNDKSCWCVKTGNGKAAFNNQKLPLNHHYDCKSKYNVYIEGYIY